MEPWLPASGSENKIFQKTEVMFPIEKPLAVRALKL